MSIDEAWRAFIAIERESSEMTTGRTDINGHLFGNISKY